MKQKSKAPETQKQNFITLFYRYCELFTYENIPRIKVLSCNPIITGYWSSYVSTLSRHYIEIPNHIDIYIMYENNEKDGILRRLFVKNSEISPIFLFILNEVLDVFNTLTHLRLERCSLYAENINSLKTLLINFPCLTDLNIDGNPNTEQNFWVLLCGTNLEFLSVANCKIDETGLKMISKILMTDNFKLRGLTLSGNFIDDKAVSHLADALRINRVLLSVDLLDNWITNKGCNYLMASLQDFVLKEGEKLLRKQMILDYIKVKEQMRQELLQKYSSSEATILKQSRLLSRSTTPSLKSKKSLSQHSKESLIEREIDKNVKKPDNIFYTDTFVLDQEVYCKGNLRLVHLNLSYNKIGEDGYVIIKSTLENQERQKNESTGNGLCHIDLVGNINDNCRLAIEIKNMLSTKISTGGIYPRRSTIQV